ncbi:MAG: hypothetical protein Q4F79_03540 [Eubacteriales bacterium]|nr:hypothetical protein [Eubacteriales bacterium]
MKQNNKQEVRRRVHGVRRDFMILSIEQIPKAKTRRISWKLPKIHWSWRLILVPFRKLAGLVRLLCRKVRMHKEGVRTLAIVVLIATLVGQSGWLWTRVLDRNSTPKGTLAHAVVRWMDARRATDLADTTEPAAYPVKLAIRSNGSMFGIQYSASGVAEAYRLMEDMWSAALSSAGRLEPVQQNEYVAALKNDMAFVEFDGSIPLELIAGWMGAETPQGGDARTCGGLLLSRTGTESYRLFVRDAVTGTAYSATTELTTAQFSSTAESFVANDCTMAAETDTVIAPDTLQFTGEQTFVSITFGPYTGSMATILEALRMDGRAAQETAYATGDSTRVYVDDESVVRVTQDGVLTYRSETGLRAYEQRTLREQEARQKCAQLGRNLSAELLDAMNSGGEAHLTKAYVDDNGRYVTVFSMRINGVPADNDLGYFARYEFEEGAMVRADVVLRTCEAAGSAVTVMPEKVAASSLRDATAMLSLRYTDRVDLLPDDDSETGSTTQNSQPLTTGQGTASGYLDTGTSTTDDSWVTGSVKTETGINWSGSLNGTEQSTTEAGRIDETTALSTTTSSMTAEVQWKFLRYSRSLVAEEETKLPNGTPEISCHMPNFLTPLGEGGEQG